MIKTRFFVLAEPYGPLDFTICGTADQAVRTVERLREQGKNTRLVESTGTAHDIRSNLRDLRAEYVAQLAQDVAS